MFTSTDLAIFKRRAGGPLGFAVDNRDRRREVITDIALAMIEAKAEGHEYIVKHLRDFCVDLPELADEIVADIGKGLIKNKTFELKYDN